MEMPGTDGGKIPKSYSLNMFKDFVPMCVLSEANQGKVAMKGKVEHKFDMKPHGENLEEYGRLCRERTKKSMIKNRQIQVIDNDRGVHMRPMPGMIGLISSTSKDKKKTAPVKQPDMKRTRRDRGQLEDIMFKLFEKQPNWALKQLVQETDQPEDSSGKLASGAIANLVDEVGGAVVHVEGLPMNVSVDMSISFISTARVHDELEITSRVLGQRGAYSGTIVLMRNKATGEIIAEGRHSLFGRHPSKL